MIAVDYFCGAGGASFGLYEAGYDTVVSFDSWSVAVDTHRLALPYVGSCNIHDLSDDSLDYWFPAHPDVAWFSPPCPPFSAAGLGAGYIDPGDMFPSALRIIRSTKPSVVFIENVKGLTSKRHMPYFDSILVALRTYGYEVEWRVLNCADYGVPQTRQRCFIVARLDRQPIVWPEITHPKGDWVSMACALGWTDEALVGFPRRIDGGNESIDLNGTSYRARDLFPSDGPAQTVTEKGRSWRRWELNTGRDWKKGEDRDAAQKIPLTDPAPTVTAISGQQWQVRAGRDAHATVRSIDEPAPTVIARKDPSGWTVGCSESVIRLTATELARLQDFPDGWPWQGNKTQQFRQIGNAVPVRMARLLAECNRPEGWHA